MVTEDKGLESPGPCKLRDPGHVTLQGPVSSSVKWEKMTCLLVLGIVNAESSSQSVHPWILRAG